MALPAWQATIVNEFGDIIPSPVITVIVEATGQPAVLFSNRAGTTSLGTAGVFTAGTNGFAQFFAEPGEYRVKASDAGSGFEQTWDFVNLIIPQASPTDTDLGKMVTTGALSDNGGPIFTTGTLNVQEFLGSSASDFVAHGYADSATTAVFFLPILSFIIPSSITVVSTFSVNSASGSEKASALGSFALSGLSSKRVALLTGIPISASTIGDLLILRTESATSSIKVNF